MISPNLGLIIGALYTEAGLQWLSKWVITPIPKGSVMAPCMAGNTINYFQMDKSVVCFIQLINQPLVTFEIGHIA